MKDRVRVDFIRVVTRGKVHKTGYLFFDLCSFSPGNEAFIPKNYNKRLSGCDNKHKITTTFPRKSVYWTLGNFM